MQEGIQKRKHQEWLHLQQQYKNYKKNFHGRPLLPKQIQTYFELTNFITQLIPAFNEHYFSILTQEENAFVNQVAQTISNDLLNKLKSLAYRIQKKEIEQNNSKDIKTLCKVCIHELRAAQIAEAKNSLAGKQLLTQNILKMIRQVQQTSQPFSIEEDRRFFKELKAALKKKEEVLEICQSQGTEFISLIEEQLKGIMLNRESLIFPQEKLSQQPQIKGYQLKDDVTKSIKTHLYQKIPDIIKLVADNLKKRQERQRKLKYMNTEVQTIDAESSKIIQFKRKISALQNELKQANSQKTRLSWTLQEKQLIIDKYENQLKDLREQLSKKVYELQKQSRNLEQKNKKYRDQLQKYKSRRNIESTEHNLKSMNSFAQLKDPSFAQETPEQPEQNMQRKQKRKKTVNNLGKTNGKFYLPTIKKINNDQQNSLQQDLKKYESQQPSLADQTSIINRQSQHNANQITLISSAKVSISRNNSKEYTAQKQRNQSRKKVQRLMTISNNKDQANSVEMAKKASYKSIKTQRATESMNSLHKQLQKNQFPQVKNDSRDINSNLYKKSGQQIKRLKKLSKQKTKIIYNSFKQNESNTYNKVQQRKQLKQQASTINQKLKQKIEERSSAHSSQQGKKIRNSTKPTKQSIYKQTKKLQNQSYIQQSSYKNMQSQNLPLKRKTEKPYLRNSFSKINQQIDKQNYQTPQFQPLSTGMEDLKKIQNNQSMKHHLFQIYKQISKQSKQIKSMTIQKFSQIFQRYVQDLNKNKQEKQFTQNEENVTMAITEPTLPRINQNIMNGNILSIKQNEGYSSMSGLKKNHKNEYHLLKSRFQDQVYKSRSKQNSLNASYQLSPSMTQQHFQLSRIAKQLNLAKNKNKSLLTFQNILFFNEEIAYNYQTNFSKKKAKNIIPLNPHIQNYLNQLFAVFEQLKTKNPAFYQTISGFLRYPFSHSQNGFLQIDIIKNLSLSTLTQCFLRLLNYHKKCQVDNSVCVHLLNFKKKLQQSSET